MIEDSDALAAVAAVRGGDVLLDVTNPGRNAAESSRERFDVLINVAPAAGHSVESE